MTRTPARLSAALAATAALLIASPALAHVSVSSADAAREGYGKAVFRVPNESDDASTTRLRVTLPADQPFGSVAAQAKPGWNVEVEEADLPEPVEVNGATLTRAARTVTWTTDGEGIAPGEFDEFAISGGPFPDVESVTFAAEQTYDDGEVVDWDQVQEEGAQEPERPAPALALAASTGGGHGGSHTAEAADAADDQQTPASGSSDALARGLGGAALVVALGGLAWALRENRRRA